jgi:hypothetical protein
MYYSVYKLINSMKAMITVMNNISENSCLLMWKGGERELLVEGRFT